MTISNISSNAYWLTSQPQNTEKQAKSAEETSAQSSTQPSKTNVTILSARTNGAGHNVPTRTDSATKAALLAAQEVNASTDTPAQQWLDSMLAQSATKQATQSNAVPYDPFYKIDAQSDLAKGNLTTYEDLVLSVENNKSSAIPAEVDGIDTGFLNSRNVTMEYLSRAEDLVENHLEVAKQVFNLEDPMHRFVLAQIQQNDFTADSTAYEYQDELGQQYYEEGQKMLPSPALSALGDSAFTIDPEIMAMGANPFVATISKYVDQVASGIETIDKRQTALDTQIQKEQELTASLKKATNSERALIQREIQELQNIRGHTVESLDHAKSRVADILQHLQSMDKFGISSQSVESLFNKFYAQDQGNSGNLSELFDQYLTTA